VDKPLVNWWGNLAEQNGPQLIVAEPGLGPIRYYLGGLELAPGSAETVYDANVRKAQGVPGYAHLVGGVAEMASIYGRHLSEVFCGGALSVRCYLGEWLLLAFLAQIVMSVCTACSRSRACGADFPSAAGPDAPTDERWLPILALAASALLFFLGPLVLLRGDQPTHYLNVALPMFVLVSASGVVQLTEAAAAALRRYLPALQERL